MLQGQDATGVEATNEFRSVTPPLRTNAGEGFQTPPHGGITTSVPGSAESGITIISTNDGIERADSEFPFGKAEQEAKLAINEVLADGSSIANKGANLIDYFPKSKEEVMQKLSQPEAKFAGGMVAGKLLVGPTLNYLSDKISGENADKTIVSYYQENMHNSAITAIKTGLFYVISILPLPIKFDAASKTTLAKVASDALFNAGSAIMHKTLDPLYKMASIDYAKELGLWVTIGSTSKILSVTGANNLVDFNKVYQEHSGALGLALGASSEIANFIETACLELKSLGESYFYPEA